MFGLSCYAKMSVDSQEERGARMKSVGILSYSYTTLFRHMQFLEKQVGYFTSIVKISFLYTQHTFVCLMNFVLPSVCWVRKF